MFFNLFTNIFLIYSFFNLSLCTYYLLFNLVPGYEMGFIIAFGFVIPSTIYLVSILFFFVYIMLGKSDFDNIFSFLKEYKFLISILSFFLALCTNLMYLIVPSH